MRYFFNVRDGSNVTSGREGSELADPVAAKFEARTIARDLVIENLKVDRDLDGRQIEIADESGNLIDTIKIKDVVSAP